MRETTKPPALRGEGERLPGATHVHSSTLLASAAIPAELRARPQWVAWRYVERDAKRTKVPVDPRTGRFADTTDARTWGSVEAAVRRMRMDRLAGVGYVFSPDDPFCGIDFDGCIDAHGTLAEAVQDWLERLGTYAEVSPSARGVKAIGQARLPGARHKLTDARQFGCTQIEFYDRARFFTITGRRLAGLPSEPRSCQEALDALYAACFPPEPTVNGREAAAAAGALDDAALLDRARAASNGAKFAALFDRGDTRSYNGDDSAADLALCCELAFWTGRDAARIDRLFRQSALYRPKWDERRGASTYGALTIQRALAQTHDVYAPTSATAAPNGPAAGGAGAGEPDGPGAEPKRERRSQADRLVGLALASGTEYVHTPDGEAFARIPVDRHSETWPVRGRGFRLWLAREFYRVEGRAPGREALAQAVEVLAARALFDGAEQTVYTRVAPDGAGGLWLDLGDAAWRAVHITPGGWEIVTTPPVRFRRAPGLRPLPEPVPGGALTALRTLFRLDDQTWALVQAWLRMCLHSCGPYPVLILTGEQGSGKSTLARLLRALVDPAEPDLRAEPREVRDLMIAARANWVVALDNVSRLPEWLSDALCRLSTGGGFATRELYTDADEVLFDAKRPTLLTAIAQPATRGDLLDRAVTVHLPAIPDAERLPERELWASFHALQPTLLGALFDDIAAALRAEPQVHLDRLPRMADFARWAVAAERGRGEAPAFLAAYEGVRQQADDDVLDASPVGAALRTLLADGAAWEGTAADLLAALSATAGESATRAKGWPRSPRGVVAELHRLAPALRRALGVEVRTTRVGHQRTRVLQLSPTKGGAESSASSAPRQDADHEANAALFAGQHTAGESLADADAIEEEGEMRTVADGPADDLPAIVRNRPHNRPQAEAHGHGREATRRGMWTMRTVVPLLCRA